MTWKTRYFGTILRKWKYLVLQGFCTMQNMKFYNINFHEGKWLILPDQEPNVKLHVLIKNFAMWKIMGKTSYLALLQNQLKFSHFPGLKMSNFAVGFCWQEIFSFCWMILQLGKVTAKWHVFQNAKLIVHSVYCCVCCCMCFCIHADCATWASLFDLLPQQWLVFSKQKKMSGGFTEVFVSVWSEFICMHLACGLCASQPPFFPCSSGMISMYAETHAATHTAVHWVHN